jgi:hypothetical protein
VVPVERPGPGQSYTGRHARTARQAVLDIRQGAESRPETILRLVMVRAGLPEPELNVDIFSASGLFLGRGDTLFRDFRVIVEYDGEQHRIDSIQYNKDMLRIEGFIRERWTPIRVRKGQLFGDPMAAVARVEGALRDAGWSMTRPRTSTQEPTRRSSRRVRTGERSGTCFRAESTGAQGRPISCRTPRGPQ